METTQTETQTTTIPCGWCDKDVDVDDDHGQVVYCSDYCQKANMYTEGTGM